MKYIERITAHLHAVGKLKLPTAHQRIQALFKAIDCPDAIYMVKLGKKHPWYSADSRYIQHDTFISGLVFGDRAGAARFTRDELPEVIKRLHNLKGYSLIKTRIPSSYDM